jgi:hypothetical protein
MVTDIWPLVIGYYAFRHASFLCAWVRVCSGYECVASEEHTGRSHPTNLTPAVGGHILR